MTLIPAIASYFGVSTDELFDFNVYTIEKNVNAIVAECARYRDTDKAKCEQILRDGLKQYPGNDVLLNCLIYEIPLPERSAEVIGICKSLIEATRYDDVKYDAYRILAEAYKMSGEYALAKETIEKIPEIYFTKLGVAAKLLEGEDMFKPAVKQKSISFEELPDMYGLLAEYYTKRGMIKEAIIQLETAKKLIDAIKDDFATPYTKCLYDMFCDRKNSYEETLGNLLEE